MHIKWQSTSSSVLKVSYVCYFGNTITVLTASHFCPVHAKYFLTHLLLRLVCPIHEYPNVVQQRWYPS
jgi:hypothetical protein